MIYKMRQYLLFFAALLVLMSGCSPREVTKRDESPVSSPPVSNETPDDVSSNVHRVRDRVLEYFSPLSGSVEHVENGLVRISLGNDGSVKKGMRFSVFSQSEPFYHPVTNELIGNAENYAGRIEVQSDSAGDGEYLCRIINGDIHPGDRVRISSSRVKLAFFQDRKANWNMSEAFYDSLNDSGRFEISSSYTPDYSPETLSKLARDLGAEAVLMFSTHIKDKQRVMSIVLYWAEDAEMFGQIQDAMSEDISGIASSDEEFFVTTFSDSEPWRRFRLPGGSLISMGDVNGNGSDEFVVSDGRRVRIYSFEDELRELWQIEAKGDGSHLSLDIVDLNGNGRAEIFVTSVVNAGNISSDEHEVFAEDVYLQSFVIEYDPSEGYKRMKENMPFFLRVMGDTLLMQRFNRNRIFSGPVYRGMWTGTNYEPGEPLALPDNTNIYGFTYVDWKNEGLRDLMTYGDDGYLYLYDENGNLKWRSTKSLGPFTFTYESKTQSIVNPSVKWSVKGRLATVRTDRGQEVVAVSRESLLPAMPGIGTHKANVYSLWWSEGGMEKTLVLKEVDGAVSDYWIQGRDLFLIAKGSLFSVIGRVAEGEFSKSSILYYYKFAPLEEEN